MKFHRDPAVRDAWLGHDRQTAAHAASQVPSADRSMWASSVVAASLKAIATDDALRQLLERVAVHAPEPEQPTARELFEEIRHFSLHSPVEGLRLEVARLAELACKVIHNVTGCTPGFDDNSDVRLVEAAATVARLVPDLEPTLWRAICRRR